MPVTSSMFLISETREQPMHVGGLQLFIPREGQTAGELADEVTQIDAEWMAVAKDVTTTPVTLERTDVKVVQMALVWIPVP